MGRISYFLCFMVATLAIGCAGQTPIPTGTPEDSEAICVQAVITSRKAATALLRAGKITLEKDREIQDSLNTAVNGCRQMGVTP